MSAVGVGDPAPGFTLAGTDGTPEGHRDYELSELRGGPAVLVFYPGDNTPVCTRQLNSYTADIDQFLEVDATVWAISPQSIESHDGFAGNQGGFAFPLLADVDKAVGGAYGILGPVGFYRRSIFVVGPTGLIGYAHRSVTSLSFQPAEAVIAAVENTR